jgi:hypothetical protein
MSSCSSSTEKSVAEDDGSYDESLDAPDVRFVLLEVVVVALLSMPLVVDEVAVVNDKEEMFPLYTAFIYKNK